MDRTRIALSGRGGRARVRAERSSALEDARSETSMAAEGSEERSMTVRRVSVAVPRRE